jgi:hypothetical protein
MENMMIVLLLAGACLALIAGCQLLDSYNESLDKPQIEEMNLDNITLAEARKED